MTAAMASAAPSWSATEEAFVARPRTAPSGLATRTAILVPPTSTPTTRVVGPCRRTGGRSSAARSSRSSVHRQAELARSAAARTRRGASGRRRRRHRGSVSRGRAGRATVAWPRRGSASSHGSPRTVTDPWTTIRRTSRIPMRFATAAPSARPAPRVTARAALVAVRGRVGQRLRGSMPEHRPRRLPAGSTGALATVSRQPNRPQWHSAPSGSTTIWPISPAPSPSPPNSSPSRTSPAPMPRPTLIATRFVGPLLAFEEVGGDGGRARVVGDDGREAVALGEGLAEREVGPVEVDGPADRAVAVDDARRADADARGSACAGRRRISSIRSWTRASAVSPSRALDVAGGPRAGSSPRRSSSAGREGALAEVEGDDVAGVVDELDEGRRLAAGRGRRAGIPGEALLFELRDELADAGASQAGEAGDGSRATDRPEVVEGAEHQARVMGARLRVGRLGWKLRAGHSCSDPCHSSSVSRRLALAGHVPRRSIPSPAGAGRPLPPNFVQ